MAKSVSTKELEKRSRELFPEDDARRRAWLKTVIWLRERSEKGWALDQKVVRDPKPHILHNYRAPTESIHTVASLPEEQIVPPANVTSIPWKKTK